MPSLASAEFHFWSRSTLNTMSGSASTVSQPLARISLSSAPTRVAQRQDAFFGAAAFGDVLKNVHGSRQRHAAIDHHGRLVHVIGAVQHKAAPLFHRTAELNGNGRTGIGLHQIELSE